MFNFLFTNKSKKIKQLEKEIKEIKELNKRLHSMVFCEECGVAVKKAKEVIVVERLDGIFDSPVFISEQPTREGFPVYYCDRHMPKYDKVVKDITQYGTATKYYKSNVEVTKKGKPKD